MLASVTGIGHVTVWNVTDPARAARIATLTGLRDFVQAIAFSPGGGLLAAVTYHGTVLVFSPADPARGALAATISGIMADALYPDGRLQHPDAPPWPPTAAPWPMARPPATRCIYGRPPDARRSPPPERESAPACASSEMITRLSLD
jgi:hypothetical protein